MFGIYWQGDEARLKSYSAAANSKGDSTVRIELTVTDLLRLELILQNLAEIQRDQGVQAPAKPKKTLSPAKPLMLTYGGEK